LAQTSDVWTYDISGEQWGEVDFPEDIASAEALCLDWDAARLKAKAA
jgi:choline kinase